MYGLHHVKGREYNTAFLIISTALEVEVSK